MVRFFRDCFPWDSRKISRARLHSGFFPLVPGDRFILRESGQGVTLGGGEILDVDPIVRAAEAVPDRDVDRVVRERGRVDVDDLRRLTGVARSATVGRWVVDPAILEAESTRLRGEIADADALGLDIDVVRGDDVRLVATLDTPNGVVDLS